MKIFMMATVTGTSVFPSNGSGNTKRKSYVREFKLTVVNHYCENNLYQTSKRFSLNTKTILRWAKKGSKRMVTMRKAVFPE